jgi:two-component system, OmpR family, KDP operon response regulator KdpE
LNPRILIVDDERQLRRAVTRSLERHGYDTQEAASGSDALTAVESYRPDVVLLDLMLPDMTGVDVCRNIRVKHQMPIIILSIVGEELAKVRALDEGADDYVTKPFGMDELLARARAALRRRGAEDGAPPLLRFGDLEVDRARRLVTNAGGTVHLTPTEYGLLEAMVSEPGKLLTHQWLLRRVWGQGYGTETAYLRTYVRTLRKKLGDDATAPRLIVTEPGVGYRWIAEPTPEA